MRKYNVSYSTPIITLKKGSILFLTLFLLFSSSFDGIAQSKKKKKKPAKQSAASQNMYQDLTARYNRYFNAKLQFQEGLFQLSNQRKEDFDDVLPVFEYDPGTGTSISSNLDQVIKKTSAAVQLKPNSKWVDDCYLLLGKAYFLKGETDAAIESFQYISNRFSKHIRKSYDRKSAEQQKKLREKQKEDLKKERDKERKEAEKQREEERKQYEKERDTAKKQKAKERKEYEKERDAAKKQKEKDRAAERKEKEKEKKERDKERAKEKKESLKEKEQSKKEREKEKARITKLKAKEKKRRLAAKKKGKKYVPSAEYRAYLEAREAAKEERELEKEAKELEIEEPETPEVVDEPEEEAPQKEEKQKKEKKKKEKKPKKDKEKEEAEKETTETDEEVETEEEAASIVQEAEGSKEKTFKTGGLFSFLRHQPVKHDAMLWLLHSFIESERYSEAASILDYAQNDKTLPKRLGGLMKGLEAHYYLSREDTERGKEALQEAIKYTRKKKEKARLYYILAQLEQQQGSYSEAVTAFNKVLKSKPNYDMEFNARINIARTRLASGEYKAPRAIKYLEKMLKDDKNADYQDQILIAMSEIALESGDEELAAKYLNEAASTASLNPAQRAKSFKRLAELNYGKGNYVLAGAYYDSVMTVLPKKADNYDEMKRKQEVMSELAGHIATVELQDSLQRIANMPPGQQDMFISDLIAQFEKEAEEERLAKEQEFLQGEDNKKDNKGTGAWYFYNESAKGIGAREFRTRWGTRTLNDNWRLSSKSSGPLPGNNPVITGTSEDLAKVAAEGRLTKEMILQQLPTSGAAKKMSDNLIIDGLYGAGKVFREGLDNQEKANEYFQELIRRFPDSKHEAAAYYNLYLMAVNDENKGNQQKYKNLILSKYPDSEFAKYLEDEAYAAKAAGEQSPLDKYYDEAYKHYENGEFEEAMKMIKDAPNKFPQNSYQPKFDLLRALVIGNTQEKNDFITALEQVIVAHPKHEVTRKAEEILLYIASGGKTGKAKPKGAANYKPTADKRHYFIVTFTGKAKNIKQLTYSFSDFNKQNFSVDKLKSNNMMLDPENQIVMVKDFSNAKKAMNYYRTIQQKEIEIFKGLDVPYQYFVISKNNFSEFFKRKDASEYQEFFIKNYQ